MAKRSTTTKPAPAPALTAPTRRHVAVYPGSFDPVTYGHLDVVERGRRLFDHVVVGVGENPEKDTLFTAKERLDMLQQLVAEMVKREPDAATVEVRAYTGLTVDFAVGIGAKILLRGIRNLSDLQSEVQQAVTNREVGGLETAFVVAGHSFAYTSSTLIRQITAMGKDLSVLRAMCPELVIEKLRQKKRQSPNALRKLRE